MGKTLEAAIMVVIDHAPGSDTGPSTSQRPSHLSTSLLRRNSLSPLHNEGTEAWRDQCLEVAHTLTCQHFLPPSGPPNTSKPQAFKAPWGRQSPWTPPTASWRHVGIPSWAASFSCLENLLHLRSPSHGPHFHSAPRPLLWRGSFTLCDPAPHRVVGTPRG